jgi:hypothetical protein
VPPLPAASPSMLAMPRHLPFGQPLTMADCPFDRIHLRREKSAGARWGYSGNEEWTKRAETVHYWVSCRTRAQVKLYIRQAANQRRAHTRQWWNYDITTLRVGRVNLHSCRIYGYSSGSDGHSDRIPPEWHGGWCPRTPIGAWRLRRLANFSGWQSMSRANRWDKIRQSTEQE